MLKLVRSFRLANSYLQYVIILSILLAGYTLFGSSPDVRLDIPEALSHRPASDSLDIAEQSPPCKKLRGSEGVQIIMRTGATEIKDKLPAHFSSTFRCYQDVLIFSDHNETFQGHEVYDALENLSDEVKNNYTEFELYHRIKANGRESLQQHELSGTASFEIGKTGRLDNAGWTLDKWKFLPMVQRTLELRPYQKWYVFVESDTYLVYSNLLEWLESLDPDESLYLGSEVAVGDDIFAHGGSGFVLSNRALQRVVHHVNTDLTSWNNYTAGHWAGDCVLGKALHESGIDVSWAWPMFQGGNPATMDFKEDKVNNRRKLWCTPALTYHHLSPWEIERMWEFEQSWIENRHKPDTKPWGLFKDHSYRLRHVDVFKEYALPQLKGHRQDWQNWSPLVEADSDHGTIDDCRAICEADTDCIQYSRDSKACWLGYDPKLGQPFAGVQSGWILDRMEHWMEQFGHCPSGRSWISP